jgi:transcriptional regulator, cro/CI family
LEKEVGVMTLAEALAARVDELLEEKNLTQYKLAKLSGLAQTTIADIRKQRNRGTNIQNINAIAQGLEMDLIEFFNSPLFKRENITD